MAVRDSQVRGIELDEVGRMRFGGRTWLLARANLRGMGSRGVCAVPKRRRLPGLIVVGSHLPAGKKTAVEAVIHETLHAVLPGLSEKQVRRAAPVIRKAMEKFEARKKCKKGLG